MRSLLLATAGHVNHGKTTLLSRLTGIDPDRLPQEKARGMTLDLGFAHTNGLSFVDVPGHEGLVRHTIAGQNGVDGALFVVAFNEGLQEQSREHARILTWLGIDKVMILVTKCDLAANEEELRDRSTKIIGQSRQLFPASVATESLLWSEAHDAGPVLEKIKTFFIAVQRPADFFVSRFFIDRAFTLNGVGTVVTGTFTEGRIKKSAKATLWFGNGKRAREVTVKALRRHDHALEENAEFGRLALAIDGARPGEIVRGSCLLWGEEDFPLASAFSLELEWVLPAKNQMTALVQAGTITHQARLRRHPKGFWRCSTEVPLPWRRGDRVLVRVPQRIKNMGHTVAGGIILDAQDHSAKTPSAPPRFDADFVDWCLSQKLSNDEILRRLGRPRAEGLRLIGAKGSPPPATKAPAPAATSSFAVDAALAESIKASKWEALVPKEKLDGAHALVKAGVAHCVRDSHFLHADYFHEILAWLNEHFSKQTDLTIDDARAFFKTGRKNFLQILEFCDRLQLTYRKDLVRKKFKLPSCSRPSAGRPSCAREGETPSVRLPGSC